jgi:2'-5' RNA ligase
VSVRLFVAAWPPARVRDTLQQLVRPSHHRLRWIAPDQLHVTLAFLGEVAADRVPALVEGLRRWADDTAEVTATAGPATERLGRGVLCVAVDGLDSLALGVRSVTGGIASAQDDHPFTGHLTVARVGRRDRIPDEVVGMPMAASWTVDAVQLVSSILDPSGPRYEVLDQARLEG